MKKLFFSLMAVAAVANANAVNFGVTAGIGAATIKSDNTIVNELTFDDQRRDGYEVVKSEIKYESITSWNVGLKANEDISDKMFGEVSLLFQHQGFSYQSKTKSIFGGINGTKYDVNLYYINVPVNVGYKFGIGSDFSIAPKAGILLGFGVTGEDEGRDCNPFSELEDESNGKYEDYARFDFGINAGVNFNYKKFQLGLQYTWSIPDFADHIEDSKNRVFTANFAYFF